MKLPTSGLPVITSLWFKPVELGFLFPEVEGIPSDVLGCVVVNIK